MKSEIGKSPSGMDLRAVKRLWRKQMSKFSNYEYRKQPAFDMYTFAGANQAIPMKTLVIHCLEADPEWFRNILPNHFNAVAVV